MWTEEEVAPIPLAKNKLSTCCLFALGLFFWSRSSKFRQKCSSPSNPAVVVCCVISYVLMKDVLVGSVSLEVTLKDYPHAVFPRALPKLFLKISNAGDSLCWADSCSA